MPTSCGRRGARTGRPRGRTLFPLLACLLAFLICCSSAFDHDAQGNEASISNPPQSNNIHNPSPLSQLLFKRFLPVQQCRNHVWKTKYQNIIQRITKQWLFAFINQSCSLHIYKACFLWGTKKSQHTRRKQ